MTLETITINLVGRAVLKVHEGREYLVAPGTSIVPGVLHGSEGPLFYPHKQIARNFKDWDDTAITIFHPTDNYNIPASAKSVEILKKHGIGILKNTSIGAIGQLQHDLWFDVEYTKNADKKHGTDIYGRLTRGEPIELSTGLYTKNEPRKGIYNGKPYQFVARNYRPDHLAILPNQTGACSLQDGCGVLINEATQLEPQAKSLLTRILEALHLNAKTCPKCGMEMDGKECSECNYTENVEKTAPQDSIENAVAPGVQRHAERGQFLPRGSGTGKGEQHTAAKVGFGRVCPTCGGALDDAGFCPTCPDDDEAEAEYKAQHALEEASLTDIDEPVLASLNTDPTLEDLDY